MLKGLRVTGMLAVAALLVLSSVSTVFAGGSDGVYGLIFIDSNLNGVWDQGESGYAGVKTESVVYGETVVKYVGTTITLSPDDGATAYTLESAGYRALTSDEIENGMTTVCSYQDTTVADGADEDTDPDMNASPVRPCEGTWGLRPAGEAGTVWKVWVTAPAGYVVTSQNPQYYTVGSDTATLDFGIAPVGAGGATSSTTTAVSATSAVILPVTGMTLGFAALALVVGGGAMVVVGSKLHK